MQDICAQRDSQSDHSAQSTFTRIKGEERENVIQDFTARPHQLLVPRGRLRKSSPAASAAARGPGQGLGAGDRPHAAAWGSHQVARLTHGRDGESRRVSSAPVTLKREV